MFKKYFNTVVLSILLFAVSVIGLSCSQQKKETQKFNLIEATISDVHEAMRSGNLTARQLVEAYIKRIKYYDRSTRLNSIVVINPNALKEADKLDKEFKRTGKLLPLQGIPIIVKDNYDTKGLQTSGGSLALKGAVPSEDAYQVKKLKEAGAIVLAKSNMAEWAFSNVVTVSSIAGITRNPYDLTRVPAGSSGGTAAAVAANLGLIGLGTDTGNSIRGPASFNSLVGIRSTMGLTSRTGIIPLFLRNDIGGPLGRTVEDAVKILQVIAGYDPADPITKLNVGKIPKNYTQFLIKDGLKGARIGVLRRYIDTETIDPEIKKLTLQAIEDLKKLGAEIVDPFDIPNYKKLTKNIWRNVFRYDLNNYLASQGKNFPYKTLKEIYKSGLYLPASEASIVEALKYNIPPEKRVPPALDLYHTAKNMAFRNAVIKAMDKYKLDAIIYPTWSNQPRKIGDMKSPDGDNSQILSPQTGFPAITVPMGFTSLDLPTGLTFVGKLFSEPKLIKFAYSYEQGTKHRHPPKKYNVIK